MVAKPTVTDQLFRDEMTDIWQILSPEERKLFTQNISIQRYKKNEIIYAEGDKPIYMLCLLSGKVKIYKDGVGGRSQIIRLIRPVQYFGYRAYFAQEDYLTAAAAFDAATIAHIPMSAIDTLIKQNNTLAVFFIKHLSADLGIADARTVNLTQKHIRGRLAEALIFLMENYGLEGDGATINIYMAREDLANLSNMTTSNAIRTLSSFSTEKILVVDGRKIKVIDEEKLKKISRFG